ncbi:nuclear pore complex protein Nup85-like [Uloborus diversus]|uniref:nuclear pore complex protein Nup85-like n=1 Tax=Uloborus diversus TaxID=327109 RepID=UPI0024096F81|nr:nuclear pore complex protein Nup85-like [Uloborus diversus]
MAAKHYEMEDISILKIPDKALSRRVHAVFSPRNDFLVYGVPDSSGGCWPQFLHEVSTKAALYNQYVRKLVNESHDVFLSLNLRIHGLQDSRKSNELLKVSQKYRSVLLACLEDLDAALDSVNNEEALELRNMFTDIELLWCLLQCLIMESHSGSRVLYKLLEWIKWHFFNAEKKLEEIGQYEEPYNHPDYWDTVIQFLLQGKVQSARLMLQTHPKFQREDFNSIDELLKKMPMYVASCEISLNEFRIRWKHWQEECKIRLERGEFSTVHELETICKILCGDLDTLTLKSNLCGNWYHLMVSVLLYTDPCVSLSSLGDIARAYYNGVSSEVKNKSSLVDSIILAAMELDIINVINLSCSFNDGWWFALHMMDLLMHGNYIHEIQQKYPYHQRNHLLMSYAESLMAHSSLWQVGIDYLDQCQENGRELLELYLERIPLNTEAKARKIIYLAKKRNMDALVKTIANVMTSRAMANGQLGSALTWVMHSKDVHFADELADRWLNDYAEHRKIEGFEILKNMASCMLVSDKLTFVGKYCEFHKLFNDRNFKAAASLLVSLISSEIAPSKFQVIMLLDAMPLLEASELIFSRKDTYHLMKCLESLSICNGENENVGDAKENLIRLALVRNLARSFVIETGESDSEDDL